MKIALFHNADAGAAPRLVSGAPKLVSHGVTVPRDRNESR
jgi:hypothetical protein